jgi:hypothetical protein
VVILLLAAAWGAEPPELPQPWEISRRRAELVWPRPSQGTATYQQITRYGSDDVRFEAEAEVRVDIAPDGGWSVYIVRTPLREHRPDLLRDPLVDAAVRRIRVDWTVTAAGDVEVRDEGVMEVVWEPLSHLQLVAPEGPVRPGDAWTVEPSTVRGIRAGLDFEATLTAGAQFDGWVRRGDVWLAAISAHALLTWRSYGPAADFRYETRLLVDPADGLPIWLASREIDGSGFQLIVRERVPVE